MDRREFSARAAAGLLMAGGVGSALAQGRRPEAGKDFLVLDKRVQTDAPAGKVEVIEFFWYSCPHCYAFEPKLDAWVKRLPPDVSFKRVPVAFRDDFVPQQRLYYALEALGKLDELHAQVFQTIHYERLATATDVQILAWAEKRGLNKLKFQEVFASFSVISKARRATQLMSAYQVQGVPAMAVAGRYYVDGDTAGNMERALTVVDFLVEQTRKGA